MDLAGFKKVSYEQLQKELHKSKVDKDVHELSLAASMGVKSVGTVRNCFDIKVQTASDDVLTRLFRELELNAMILWHNGERTYLLKK